MRRLFLVVLLLAGTVAGVYWLSKNKPAPPTSEAFEFPEVKPVVKATTTFTPETNALISDKQVPLLEQINREYTRIARSVIPSVVSIVVTRAAPKTPEMDGMELFQLPPQMRPPPGRGGQALSYGSGVIISREGHIVTNHHVVQNPARIEVQLSDNRRIVGKLLGSDERADIAVIKIEADNLQALVWGDSDKAEPGDLVLAIGSPYELSESVSSGIISAKGRNPEFASGNDADYIQTDAAINPGNSGGALVNIRGELIGINAAIATRSGGFQGIGFAIPSNFARYVLESLVKTGKMVRGYLGVKIQEVTPDMQGAMDVTNTDGAAVADVQPGTPAAKAKIQRGDVIVEFDGHRVKDTATLRLAVSLTPINKETKVVVIRDGKRLELNVVVAQLPTVTAAAEGEEHEEPSAPAPVQSEKLNNVLNGIKVQNLTDELRSRLKIKDVPGVVIIEVEPGSVAEEKRLQPGDLIQGIKVSGLPLRNIIDVNSYYAMARGIKKNATVVLVIHRRGDSVFIPLKPDDN